MNWNRKPIRPPKDPARPNKLLVTGLVELQAALARADQLVKRNGVWEHGARGEYTVRAMNHLGTSANSSLNGHYELELTWHEPQPLEQSELL